MRLTIHLLCNAFRHRCSGNSPRLRTGNGLPIEVWLVAVAHELGYPETTGTICKVQAMLSKDSRGL